MDINSPPTQGNDPSSAVDRPTAFDANNPHGQGAHSSPVGTFDELVRAYRERDHSALVWKERGQVVGCLGNDVPEEFLIAAGYLPVRVCGDPSASTTVADSYLEGGFDPLVRAQFARIVDGSYSYLDHLVVSNSSDALIRVFYYLRALRQVEPDLPIPDLYFFDFLHTRFRTSALYDRDRVRDLQHVIESWRGQPITPEDLAKAIAICNENRHLLRQLEALRSPQAVRVSGVQALQVIGASLFLPRTEHSHLLRTFLAEAQAFPPLSGVRLFMTGSAQGVIFYIYESDDAPSWDFPEQRKALETLGVSVLLLDRQPYTLTNTDDLRSRISAFVESIRGSDRFWFAI